MLSHESPWHLRLPTNEHYQWFRNLVDLHAITVSWRDELKVTQAMTMITRGADGETRRAQLAVPESFNAELDALAETPLETLLDDTWPQDLLGRLEQAVWATQSATLQGLLQKTEGASDRESLASRLEQICWKLGRKCAETRWPELAARSEPDLRAIVLALNDTPFTGYPLRDGFLAKRMLRNEALLELRACPHQARHLEIAGLKEVADPLCRYHAHWLRGYAYALNSKVSSDYTLGESKRNLRDRCLLRLYSV
jgi:hypothetical protein